MRFEACYLIDPRPELAGQLRGRIDPDLAEVLLDPVVLRNAEGGKTIWTTDDHAQTVKLAFLASLRQYTGLATDAECEIALGSPDISVEVFDRWWTIRPLPGADDSTEELRELLVAHFKSVKPTGNQLVDRWLQWITGNAPPE